MAHPRHPWGHWAIVLVVALQCAALVPARPAEGGPPGRGLLSGEQGRSERSREQEHQLDLLFESTTGWGADEPPWRKLWCVDNVAVHYSQYDCEVHALILNHAIKGTFPHGFWVPFQRSLKVLSLGRSRMHMSRLLQELVELRIDRQLNTLKLEGCDIGTEIPPQFTAKAGAEIKLAAAGLTGSVPRSLMVNPRYVDLRKNQLTGGLEFDDPLFVEDLPKYIDFSENRLSGPVNVAWLTRLRGSIDLHDNGPLYLIPDRKYLPEFNILISHIHVDSLDMSNYRDLTTRDGVGGWEFLQSDFSGLKLLALPNARLNGVLPSNLLSKCLTVLELTNNNLSGEIPSLEGTSCYPMLSFLIGNNSFTGYLSDTLMEKSATCDISNNLFLCPLAPSIAAACAGTCADTCYNSGTLTKRGQPCECVGGFHGDHCEVFDMPGDGPALNCTAPGLDLELAICTPLPEHCDICQAGPARQPCAREVIQQRACVHGRCVRNEARELACVCNDDYYGTTCTQPKGYIVLNATLVIISICAISLCLIGATALLACWQRKRYRVAKAQRDTRITELEEGLLQAVELHESMASEIDIAGISVMEVLGEGASARVFLVRWQGKPAVLKQYRDEFTYEGYVVERKVFESLRHPNIVRYWGHVEQPPCILMEYCDGGSLYDAIRSSKNVIQRSDEILMLALDIARGVSYLHGKGLVHRDIKSHNILMARGRPKVADFDTAKRIAHEGGMTMKTGTVRWMAPEVMVGGESSGQYGRSVDIWSLACVVWEMYTHQIPYFQYEWAAEVAQAIASGETPMDKGCRCDAGATRAMGCPYYMHVPGDVEVLLRDCWSMDPAARPSIAEVVSRLEELTVDSHGQSIGHAPI